jgi:hypothetical protein
MVTNKDDFFSGMLLAPMLKLVIFLLFLKKYEVFGSNKGVLTMPVRTWLTCSSKRAYIVSQSKRQATPQEIHPLSTPT